MTWERVDLQKRVGPVVPAAPGDQSRAAGGVPRSAGAAGVAVGRGPVKRAASPLVARWVAGSCDPWTFENGVMVGAPSGGRWSGRQGGDPLTTGEKAHGLYAFIYKT